jgi:hypothetical protein
VALMLLQVALLVLVGWLLLRQKKAAKNLKERIFKRSMAWAVLPALGLLAASGVWYMRGARHVNVLKAKKDLPAFKLLQESDIEESRSPSPPDGAVRSKADALGSVMTSSIRRDALLTETMLLKEQPAEGQTWFLLAVSSSTSPPKAGSRVTLWGLKAGSEKPVPLGDDCLVVGAEGEKVVVALSQVAMSAAMTFMQPNSSLIAVTSMRHPERPPIVPSGR